MIYNYYRTERLYLFESNKFLINTVVKSDRFREKERTGKNQFWIEHFGYSMIDIRDNYLNNPWWYAIIVVRKGYIFSNQINFQ